jgi:hypothetical protein
MVRQVVHLRDGVGGMTPLDEIASLDGDLTHR